MKTDTTQEATDKGAKEGGAMPHLTTVDETASGPSAGVQQPAAPTNQSSMTDTAGPQLSKTAPPSTAASQTAAPPINTSPKVGDATPSTPTSKYSAPTAPNSKVSTPPSTPATTKVLTTTPNESGSPKKDHLSVLSAKHLNLK